MLSNCRILLLQCQLLALEIGVKEYSADWLENTNTVLRDTGGILAGYAVGEGVAFGTAKVLDKAEIENPYVRFGADLLSRVAAVATFKGISKTLVINKQVALDKIIEVEQEAIKKTEQEAIKKTEQEAIKKTEQEAIKKTEQEAIKKTEQEAAKLATELKRFDSAPNIQSKLDIIDRLSVPKYGKQSRYYIPLDEADVKIGEILQKKMNEAYPPGVDDTKYLFFNDKTGVLIEQEELALRRYTAHSSDLVNSSLKGGLHAVNKFSEAQIKEVESLISNIHSALSKLPRFRPTEPLVRFISVKDSKSISK